MKLIKINIKDADKVAPLVAAFRVQLKSYKGIKAQPNIAEAKQEIIDFLRSDFPICRHGERRLDRLYRVQDR